jgi:hypothetical protein
VDVAPLMRWGGVVPPSLSQLRSERPSQAGGVRVAVSADGHQAASQGLWRPMGLQGRGESGWARVRTPPGWTPLILR